ncbi:MAG: TetR/AcrR family transcriptional regulator [Sandaracinaceae bacterium]
MDVRSNILDVATRRFAANGVDGTSLSAIAGDVGVRKPSLLYHFPSKDALHQAVLDGVLSRWNEVLPRLLEAASGDDRFDALLDETVAFFLDDPDRARLVLREILDRPDAMRDRLAAAVQPWIRVIAGYVERAQAHGEVRGDVDPRAYVVHVIHMIVGGIAIADTLGVVLGGEDERQRLVTELKRLARVGLFTERAPTG